MRIRINPRWEKAPFEQTLVWDKKVHSVVLLDKSKSLIQSRRAEFSVLKDPYPYRFQTVSDWEKFTKERKQEYAVPWFIVEQPDGTWKESF